MRTYRNSHIVEDGCPQKNPMRENNTKRLGARDSMMTRVDGRTRVVNSESKQATAASHATAFMNGSLSSLVF